METVLGAILVALLLAFVVGRRVVLWFEMKNAARTRGEREAQARRDHERFERELTEDRMRAGAR